jgi:hypothetical protein
MENIMFSLVFFIGFLAVFFSLINHKNKKRKNH